MNFQVSNHSNSKLGCDNSRNSPQSLTVFLLLFIKVVTVFPCIEVRFCLFSFYLEDGKSERFCSNVMQRSQGKQKSCQESNPNPVQG